MGRETENQKAVAWLPDDLFTLDDREQLLSSVNPALLLAGDGLLPLWASDAAARAVGFRNADVFMRRRLAKAAPGAQRLSELASTLEVGESPRLERLRFYVGFRRVSVTALCQVIELANGERALLVSFPAEAGEDEEEMAPSHPELSKPANLFESYKDADSPYHERTIVNDDEPELPIFSVASPSLEKDEPNGGEADLFKQVTPLFERKPPEWVEMPAASRRMQRFVFTLDSEGILLTLSPALSQAVGASNSLKIGDNFVQYITALDQQAGLYIERAIAAKEIWSDIAVDWPIEGTAITLPVTLAALPSSGKEAGFSGFGRLHFERVDASSTTLEKEADAGQAVASFEHIDDVTFQDNTLEANQKGEDQALSADDIFKIIPDGEPEDPLSEEHSSNDSAYEAREGVSLQDILNAQPPEQATDLKTAHFIDEEGRAASFMQEQAQQTVKGIPHQEVSEKATPEIADSPPFTERSNVTALPLRPPKPAENAANVVTLRAGQATPVHGTTPQQGGLSLSERHAFREIAKALGARFDEDAPIDNQRARAAIQGYAAQRQRSEIIRDGDDTNASPREEAIPFWPDETAAQHNTEMAVQNPPPSFGETSFNETTSLFDRLPIGVLVLKGDVALFANRTLLDLTGYVDFSAFVAENGVQAIFRKSSQPNMVGAGFDTIVLATREGEMLPVEAHLQLIDWQGARATLMSLRRAAELEQGKALRSVAVDLRRARAEATELRNILDTATDGVITLDEDGKTLSLNSAAEALFGLNQNEVIGEPFLQLFMNESHADALDYLEGMKANGVKSVLNDGREIFGRERNGGRIPLFMTLGHISEEEPRRFCAVLRDLTAWKRAEGQLQEAKRAAESASAKKSDFLTRISHEIRTPINAIIGFAEVMEEERLGPISNPRYKEYLGDIRMSGRHVVSLVNDLLDLAKIEAGRMELTFVATDINSVIAGCIGLIQPQANTARVLVRSQLAPKLPKVVADERSIRQIVLNMLSNATRYTQSGGQVIVSTALLENGEAVIRIRDTGVGMTKAEIEKALEPFQQVGSGQKTGGTGLGLPLTKALVDANRANFAIRSTPGEGTLVEITFPATRVLAE